MRFELTDDQQAIRETARDFLASRYPAEEVRRLVVEEKRGFPDE
jgi:alkylation response protein AidB-like acyl-CoA dehydrogenase